MKSIELKVTKSPKGKNNEMELAVEASSSVSDKAYALALKEIAGSVDVPGFRKGFAPREMVEKNVGVGFISQKAFEKVFYEVLSSVAFQEKLDIVDVINISSFELLPNKPLTLKVVVEVKPEVKLGKYKGLKLKTKKVLYDKEIFIKKTIEKIANNLVNLKKITDRAVKEGDVVTLDFEGKFEDGKEVPGGKAENFQAILEKDKFLPEFVQGLQGSNIGETKEVIVTFPENYAKEFSGKKAKFAVKVHSIEERIMPDINDELAKKVGLGNLDELRNKIVEQMEQIQEVNNKRSFENVLLEELVHNSTFEISNRMIEREIDYLLKDLKMQCEKNNIKWADFQSDEKNKELFKQANEESKKRISTDLVLSNIIKDESIKANNEEIEKELKDQISKLGEKYKYLENDPRFRSAAELVVLRSKAIDFLVKNNEPIWEEEILKEPPA